jgi:hypothetical protein
MFNSKDQPDGCKNEESLSKLAKDSSATETERNYASIITAVTERFKAQK